ncbi:MAG: DUF2029 domain-containing protein [Flavobacteriales bacterium]|nr:DUF2029 domain-containing protein [Flavobacteriales bacterium]
MKSLTRRYWHIAFLAVLLLGFLMDMHLARRYGGIDLRDKVLGSRSLLEGRSPYFDPWEPGEPERFADPMVPVGASLTRFTGTPFQALVMIPLGLVPYDVARYGWAAASYLLLLIPLYQLARHFGSDHRWWAFPLVAGGMVACTSWHLHVERGQVYVIYGALISWGFLLLHQRRDLLFGVLAAGLILFKPTYALLFVPLILHTTRRMWLGGLAVALLSVAAFLALPNGLAPWMEYRDAMAEWTRYATTAEPVSLDPDAFVYPPSIEGREDLTSMHPMEFENSSAFALAQAFLGELPGWTSSLLMGAWGLLLLILFRTKWRSMSRADLLLMGFILWLGCMLVLPVPRFDYQVVQWAGPLLYLLLLHRLPHGPWPAMAGLGVVLVVGALDLLPVNVLLGECLWSIVIMATLLQTPVRLQEDLHSSA